jgi:hypothetical protein
VASETVSDLVGQCGASGRSGCISAVSGLRGRGVCWSRSMAETLEVLELARVCWRDWVGLGSMRYSSQLPTLLHHPRWKFHAVTNVT